MKISTQIITKNNEYTIETCLQSVLPLGGEILIGDNNSEDATLQICKQYGVEVVNIVFGKNFSKSKNALIEHTKLPWCLSLEPWEVIATGHSAIKDVKTPTSHSFQVLQGNVMTKETRLWHKSLDLQFINPVFETLDSSTTIQLPGVLIYSNKMHEDYQEKLDIIKVWIKNNPLDQEPHYYEAFTHLGKGDYKNFLIAADKYLFHNKSGMSAIMMQYYVATTQLYVFSNTELAVRNIIPCIALKPLMAEFWCLIGDIYYKINEYKRAILYYENATILGKRRLQADEWPVEIIKYKQYPLEMIENCKHMLDKSTILINTKNPIHSQQS